MWEAFIEQAELVELNVPNIEISDSMVKLMSEKLCKLEKFGMYNISDNEMKYIKKMKHLTSLDIGFTNIYLNGWKTLCSMNNLKEIDLTEISEAIGFSEFEKLPLSMKQLTSLTIQSELDIYQFKVISQLTNLQHLDIRGAKIDIEGIKSITSSLKQLKSINLRSNKIGNEEVKLMSESFKNQQLTCLDVGDNNIEMEGVQYICDHLKHLTRLIIFPIGNEELKLICESLPKLEYLNIHRHNITKEGIEPLKLLNRLRKVRLLPNKNVSKDDLTLFAEQLGMKFIEKSPLNMNMKK